MSGFIPLAEDHQAYLGKAGQIFTFQTHPEMDDMAVHAVLNNTDLYTKDKSEAEMQAMVKRSAHGHDGIFLLDKVIRWVYDHN